MASWHNVNSGIAEQYRPHAKRRESSTVRNDDVRLDVNMDTHTRQAKKTAREHVGYPHRALDLEGLHQEAFAKGWKQEARAVSTVQQTPPGLGQNRQPKNYPTDCERHLVGCCEISWR